VGESRGDYWAALDGLRGIAVAAVLLYHFGAPVGTGGYLGVDLFFVISGCVVTTSLRRSLAKGATLPEFFVRRAARLLPNLLLLLTTAELWDRWHDGSWFGGHGKAVLTGITQTSNLWSYGGRQEIGHLWSLSEEWQFYLILPFLLPAFCARGVSTGVRWAFGVAAASMALRPIMDLAFHATVGHIYLWPITRLDNLMLGVAVALLVEQGRRPSNPTLPLVAGAGVGGALLLAPFWYLRPELSLFGIMPAVALGSFVLVWSLVSARPDAALNRFLALSPLQYLGKRSYSVYLWHYFLGVAVIAHGETWHGASIFARQVTLSLLVGFSAYAWLEQPARARVQAWLDRRAERASDLTRSGEAAPPALIDGPAVNQV
jgi:peptidoglycan/LPS O-acetylase OafA/YrhL